LTGVREKERLYLNNLSKDLLYGDLKKEDTWGLCLAHPSSWKKQESERDSSASLIMGRK
jgi:hypothetical protein